jgi:hypothetical protein
VYTFGSPVVRTVPAGLLISILPNFEDVFGRANRLYRVDSPKSFDPLEADFDPLDGVGSCRSFDQFESQVKKRLDKSLLKILSQGCHKELSLKIRSLQYHTLKATWIGREIDKITAMCYFVIIVSIFISAEFFLVGFLDKFLVTFQGNSQARVIILIFSIVALGTVSFMLYWRLKELQSKAKTTFLYLVELDGIKFEKERFDKSLQEIERYLTNGDWTLAEYWVKRITNEYDELIKAKLLEGREKKE